MLSKYLIDEDHNFSRFRCFFLLVQVILGNVNGHSGFPTPCREAYNDVLPLQGRLGHFQLVRPEIQLWLGGCSLSHILIIWRRLQGRKLRKQTTKQLRLGSLKWNMGPLQLKSPSIRGPNQSIFCFLYQTGVSSQCLQDTAQALWKWPRTWEWRGKGLTGWRTRRGQHREVFSESGQSQVEMTVVQAWQLMILNASDLPFLCGTIPPHPILFHQQIKRDWESRTPFSIFPFTFYCEEIPKLMLLSFMWKTLSDKPNTKKQICLSIFYL